MFDAALVQAILMRHLPAGVVVHRPDTTVALANEFACAFLGLTQEQLAGRAAVDPAWAFLRDDGSPMTVEEYPVSRVCATGEPVRDLTIGVRRGDGSVVWGAAAAFPVLPDGPGVAPAVLVTFVDVTARHQAEARQRHLNDVLRAIRNVNQLITQEKDRERLLAQACDLLTDSRGYHSAWIGLPADGRVYADAATLGSPGLEAIRARAAHGAWPACCNLVDGHARVVVVHDTATACPGCGLASAYVGTSALVSALHHAGHSYGVLVVAVPTAIANDPEEQSLFSEVAGDLGFALHAMQAETARWESEQRFRTLIDAAPEGIFVQADGVFRYVNAAMAAILGAASPEAVLGKPFLDIIAPEFVPLVLRRISTMLELGNPAPPVEQEYVRLDGTRVPVETAAVPLRFEGELAHLVFVRDISMRRKSDADRALLQQQLQQAQKIESIGRLAGGVAHDFNNILTVQKGYCEMLSYGLRPEDPLAEGLAEIEACAERASGLTRQLLAFSRRQALQPRAVDLNDLVSNLSRMLRRLIGEDIDMAVRLAPERAIVMADAGQIEQVLVNLAVNARDAMPHGGRLAIEIAMTDLDEAFARAHLGSSTGPHVRVIVRDTGCGMDAETVSRVFEPFFTTKPVGQGTGLGLATVHGIVHQSGGTIWVESQVGAGTAFTLYLPRIADAQDADVAVEPPVAKGTGELVLLVEDEPALLRLARLAVESLGYRVTAVANGGEALIQVEEAGLRPDLILTDVVMPGMSGRLLVDRLRRTLPHARVLYMSGYTDDAVVRHGIGAASLNFLPKPFSLPDLAKAIRTALGRQD